MFSSMIAVMPSDLDTVIYWLGCVSLFTWIVYFLKVLLRMLYPGPNIKERYPKGSYAVITGGNRGIGRGYAEEFARQGMNLLLIARTMSSSDAKYKDDTLVAAEKYIKEKYPDCDVRLLKADLGESSQKTWDEVTNKLADVQVGVLVNNAGVSYDSAMYFTDVDPERIDLLIGLNVTALTRMTRIVLEQWAKCGEKGDIINVTSYAGVGPAGDPLYAVYSGTKAYVAYFSKSLRHELRGKGINVECHVPHFVASRMSRIRRATIVAPSPKAWARAAVGHIGRPLAGPLVTPHWFHAFVDWVFDGLPEFVTVWCFLWHHHGVRKAYLKKQEQESQKKMK